MSNGEVVDRNTQREAQPIGFGGLGEDVTPVSAADPMPVDPGPAAETLGELIDGGGARLAIATATARVPLPMLGASRRVRLCASVRTHFRFGNSTVDASVAATSTPLPVDAAEYFIVPAGATHIAGIAETGSGHLHIAPVAG